MSYGSKEFAEIADQLKRGEAPTTTVRTLLSWFSAQRRGYYIVQMIRDALNQVGVQTDPDFEFTYIDAPIRFVLKPPEQETRGVVAPPADDTGESAALLPAVEVAQVPDPTYRIGLLPSANRPPLCVRPAQRVQEAITLMLGHDYSQLPVMETEREVKGIVGWSSIGRRLALGLKCDLVRECMDPAHVINYDAPLFTAIEAIVQHDYVLIQQADKRVGGIVTTADLSLEFRQLAEPFLLLGEIENHVRRLIRGKFTKEELVQVRDPDDDDREVGDVHDLTFGEYIRLLERPESWVKLKLDLDRALFVKSLNDVRQIRNGVMHFDPDPVPEEEISKLREFAKMMQLLRQTGAI